jgi:predicted nucleic acid-binding protein
VKVFLDTNVWLSATVFAGLCEALVTECADNGWLVSSPLVRVEAHAVLARKFPHLPQALALFDNNWREAELIADVPDPADDNDVRLVAAAAAAGAGFFVTGDRRVLGWKQRDAMRIVAPREAWIDLFAPHLREV